MHTVLHTKMDKPSNFNGFKVFSYRFESGHRHHEKPLFVHLTNKGFSMPSIPVKQVIDLTIRNLSKEPVYGMLC